MIIVTDDADRENEGDLIVAAELATTAQLAFMVRHTTGIICAPMPAARADALGLQPMVVQNTDAHATAFTVSVDLAGTGTGVSAAARASTIRALADPLLRADELRRPGHVFPLRARSGGVLVRPGHTEAAVDLLTMAGCSGVGALSEIVASDGSMLRGAELARFAAVHDLATLTIADLIRHRRSTERLVERIASAAMPTTVAEFRAVAYRDTLEGTEHLALVLGDVAAASDRGALVRVHSECLTGDVLSSLRCDCGVQLQRALQAVAAEGCGVVVYLRGHEGRGIGLAGKIRAYALQQQGLDTVDANLVQGLPVDSRCYSSAAQILADLGVRRARLITNNPAKSAALAEHGIEVVEQVDVPTELNPYNIRYLQTKRDRLGHTAQTTRAHR
jgi:3,4-dihydroxy 2-butanone 4-phosphate synthase/GTP cyclohydrolase II